MRTIAAASILVAATIVIVVIYVIFVVFGVRRDETVVFDLIDEFPFAEWRCEVAEIDFGVPEAHRHLIRGWSGDEGKNRFTFVWSYGDISVLEFYLSETAPLRIQLEARPFECPTCPEQRVKPILNGYELAELNLIPGISKYNIDTPPGSLRQGVNSLKFRYAFSARPSAVREGKVGTRPLAVAWYSLRFRNLDSEETQDLRSTADVPTVEERVLRIPVRSSVSYTLDLPTDAELWIDTIVTGAAQLKVAITAQSENSEPKIVSRQSTSNSPNRIRIRGSGLTQLTIETSTAEGYSLLPGQVELLNPRIVTFAEQPENTQQSGDNLPPPDATAENANVLLYVIGTLRADHLGIYGYDRGVSPNIDSFARDAVVFRRALAQTPWTRASAASILTGMPPIVHKVEDRDDALASEATTLAEMLRIAGYQTSAIIANGNVASEFGFDQGFDDFLYLRGIDSGANTVHGAFLEWLDGRSQSLPFFAYVHTVDPHSSYRAPDVYHRQFSPGVDYELGGVPFLKELQLHRNPVPPDLPGKIESLYDSTVAFVDAEFGTLVQELTQRGLYDQTLIIFVSDHGEEFYEHGNWEHGKSLYSEVVNVPLIIRFPDGMGFNAASVDRPASHVDIVPTVLEAVGLVAQNGDFGRSLVPSEISSQSNEGAVYLRANLDGWVGNSVAYQGWKLIEFYKHERSTRLFNLTDDPQETQDLFPMNRVRAGFLLALLRKYEAKAGESIAAATATPDEKLIEELKALGYLQ